MTRKVGWWMLTLALDPGGTSGYALLTDDGSVRACGNWKPEDIDVAMEHMIRAVNRSGHELEIVIEQLAVGRQGPLATTLAYVTRTIDNIVALYDLPVYRFPPGEWKTSSAGRLPLGVDFWDGQTLTPHQKDAIRLGRYRLQRRSKKLQSRERWTDE